MSWCTGQSSWVSAVVSWPRAAARASKSAGSMRAVSTRSQQVQRIWMGTAVSLVVGVVVVWWLAGRVTASHRARGWWLLLDAVADPLGDLLAGRLQPVGDAVRAP